MYNGNMRHLLRKIAFAYARFAVFAVLIVVGNMPSKEAIIFCGFWMTIAYFLSILFAWNSGPTDAEKYSPSASLNVWANLAFIATLLITWGSCPTGAVFFVLNGCMAAQGWSLLIAWDAIRPMRVVEPGVGLEEKKALVDRWDNDALRQLAEKLQQQRQQDGFGFDDE
jgi:hypothetical protein